MRPVGIRQMRRARRGRRADPRVDQLLALGEDHPLVRVERTIDHVTNHVLTCAGFVLATPLLVAMDGDVGFAVGASAAGLGLALLGAIRALRGIRRSRIHDLILSGKEPSLPVVLDELDRLRDLRKRLQLAAALERALDQGEHWHEFLPASRPPCGVRNLPVHGRVIRLIAEALRSGDVSPRAVVLVERLLSGGYGGAIYEGGPEWLRRELGRIGFELARRPAGSGDPGSEPAYLDTVTATKAR